MNIKPFKYVASAVLLSLVNSPFALAKNVNVTVFDESGKPASGIVVYLELPTGVTVPVVENVVEVAQIDKSFKPYVGVMQKGSDVLFYNQDNITHHIYSPVGKNKFSVKVMAGEKKNKSDFKGPGEVSMGCNIHDWMSGHLLIVDTPYFTKTDDHGLASFDVADPGDYSLVIWHPQFHQAEQTKRGVLSISDSLSTKITLLKPMSELPNQKSDDDFDFLSDY